MKRIMDEEQQEEQEKIELQNKELEMPMSESEQRRLNLARLKEFLDESNELLERLSKKYGNDPDCHDDPPILEEPSQKDQL